MCTLNFKFIILSYRKISVLSKLLLCKSCKCFTVFFKTFYVFSNRKSCEEHRQIFFITPML